MSAKFILVGVIVAAHGVRGQMKIKSFTTNPEDIFSYAPLWNENGTHHYVLQPCGFSGNSLLAKIDGITSREAVDALKGTKLYIERTAFPALMEDEFYIEDLIGLAAHTPNGEFFGSICAVYNFGAGDLIEIKTQTGETQLFAFNRATFPQIDIAQGKVTLDPPEEIESNPSSE